jgi:prepilin-type N-terminal cleavage/methylation domain-containing protein
MRSKKCRKAFTLVELLVVIGIIALLIGILLPSLNKAREQARRVVCLSNMHQLAVTTAVYSTNNKGHYPVGVVDLANGCVNEEYITNELYLYSGAPPILTSAGLWNNAPLAKMWTCPSSYSGTPTPEGNPLGDPVIDWPQAHDTGNGYGANAVTSYLSVIDTSYAYCGVGFSFPSTPLATAQSPISTTASFVQNYTNLSQNAWVSGSQQVLFAEKLSWNYHTGITSNHGLVVHAGAFGNPMVPGLNEIYADGHGTWVNMTNVPLLNAGQAEGPPSAASNPVISYPQTLPLPRGYPAVMYQASYPFYEMWYW